MTTETLLRRLTAALDEKRWDDVAALLAPDFTCTLVHTGEVFGRDDWVQFNAHYPGFVSMSLEDVVAAGDRGAYRASVVGLDAAGTQQRFALAAFVTANAGLLTSAVEVWTDTEVTPPEGSR